VSNKSPWLSCSILRVRKPCADDMLRKPTPAACILQVTTLFFLFFFTETIKRWIFRDNDGPGGAQKIIRSATENCKCDLGSRMRGHEALQSFWRAKVPGSLVWILVAKITCSFNLSVSARFPKFRLMCLSVPKF